jgi:hypothetical protein
MTHTSRVEGEWRGEAWDVAHDTCGMLLRLGRARTHGVGIGPTRAEHVSSHFEEAGCWLLSDESRADGSPFGSTCFIL